MYNKIECRRALLEHRNDTQAALEFLINGGKFQEIQEVRMPTTIQRLKMMREKRKAALAKEKAKRQAEKAEKGEGRSKGSTEKPGEDDETESPREENKAPEEVKKPPAEVVDLIGYGSTLFSVFVLEPTFRRTYHVPRYRNFTMSVADCFEAHFPQSGVSSWSER